jgi:hypothetical protein
MNEKKKSESSDQEIGRSMGCQSWGAMKIQEKQSSKQLTKSDGKTE